MRLSHRLVWWWAVVGFGTWVVPFTSEAGEPSSCFPDSVLLRMEFTGTYSDHLVPYDPAHPPADSTVAANGWFGLTDHRAYGDLDGDGDADMAVVSVWSGGGSGHFYEVRALTCDDGHPVSLDPAEMGDRVQDINLRIIDGEIEVGWTERIPVLATDEGLASSEIRIRRYRVLEGWLSLLEDRVSYRPWGLGGSP